VVNFLDRLATLTDGDAVGQALNDEGAWALDNINAETATPLLTTYLEAISAALGTVSSGEDLTADVEGLVGMRDDFAEVAGFSSAPTSAPAAAAFAPITLTGKGSKVAKFTIPEDVPAIASVTHAKSNDNFVVWSVDASGNDLSLLVNTIGRYQGTRLFDMGAGEHSVAFKIEGPGIWKIVVKPVTHARTWDSASRLTGKGDDVVLVTGEPAGLATVTIKHRGSENFVVHSYSADDSELLVNEIGNYSGESILPSGTLLLEVEADGTWSVAPS
jgi:hypothetical protein